MHERLTNRQIAFFIFSAVLGYGIISLPKVAAENAGTGAWIALLLATGISVFVSFMLAKLAANHPGKTVYDYGRLLLGKFVGQLVVWIYAAYFFLIFTMILRNSSEVIKVNLLVKTPVWALNLLFLAVVYYAVVKRLKSIAMLCELYSLLIILSILVVHTIIFTQGDILLLRPFFGTGDVMSYIRGASSMIIPFLGTEILTVIPAAAENRKKLALYAAVIVGIIGFLYIFMVESSFSVRSADQIISYKDALIEIIRSVDVPYLEFLSRLDGLFFISWIMAIFTTLTVFSYGTCYLLGRCFDRADFRLLSFLVLLFSYIVSLLPHKVSQAERILEYTGYAGLLTSVVIPAVLLLMTKVGKNAEKV